MLTILPLYSINLLLNQHFVKQAFQISEIKAICSSHYHCIKQFEFYFCLSYNNLNVHTLLSICVPPLCHGYYQHPY